MAADEELVADVARRLSDASSLDYATAWNFLNPPNGALAPVMAELMCRRQEIKALLEALREFVDGHVLTSDEREHCVALLESLAPEDD